jgi:hypothetical protein
LQPGAITFAWDDTKIVQKKLVVWDSSTWGFDSTIILSMQYMRTLCESFEPVACYYWFWRVDFLSFLWWKSSPFYRPGQNANGYLKPETDACLAGGVSSLEMMIFYFRP